MILNKVTHYKDTNSVEATWVDIDGNIVKCHSYSDIQMDMLRLDLGTDITDYEAMILEVGKNIKPIPPRTQEEIDLENNALAMQELEKLDRESIRAMREWIAAQPTAPQILKDKEAAAILERTKLK